MEYKPLRIRTGIDHYMPEASPDLAPFLPSELDNLRPQIDVISRSLNAFAVANGASYSLAINRNAAERSLHDVDMLKNLLAEREINFTTPTGNDIRSVKEVLHYLRRMEGCFSRIRDTLKNTCDSGGIPNTQSVKLKMSANEEETETSVERLQEKLNDIQRYLGKLINTTNIYIKEHDPSNQIPEPIQRDHQNAVRHPKKIDDALSPRTVYAERELEYRPPPPDISI